MEFSMNGEGGISRSIRFFFVFFAYKPSTITPWLPKRILHIVWALYYVKGKRSQSAVNKNLLELKTMQEACSGAALSWSVVIAEAVEIEDDKGRPPAAPLWVEAR